MSIALPQRAHDLTDERSGTWQIVGLHESTRRGCVRWLARCDCGREKVISAGNWRMGSGTTTCICLPKKPNYNQLPDGEASFNLLYASYADKARRRGYDFSLNREEFKALTKMHCAYCGRPPEQTRKTGSGTPYVYMGIDRIDSSSGYVAGNIAPCCLYCNRSKSDLTLAEWKQHIQAVWERLCK